MLMLSLCLGTRLRKKKAALGENNGATLNITFTLCRASGFPPARE